MTLALYLAVYLAILAFLTGCAVRAVGYARLPIHLRWELYPVPHEDADRVRHGGSYFEASDWWTKPRPFNLMGELKSMVPEILFLKALRENNPRLWLRSFPFHFGLYLTITACGILLFAAILGLLFSAFSESAPGLVLQWLYSVTGVGGLVLIVWGSLGLLRRRFTDSALSPYTTGGDIFNLLIFVAAVTLLVLGYLLRPAGSPSAIAVVQGLITFDTSIRLPGLLAAGLVGSAALLAYIPFTHMSHFIAKYFTYHSIRWDDEPSLRGSQLAAQMAEYLTYRPSWSAPHVGADGTRQWADIAHADPGERAKK
jgi:nitrate reductase gamma subunit